MKDKLGSYIKRERKGRVCLKEVMWRKDWLVFLIEGDVGT